VEWSVVVLAGATAATTAVRPGPLPYHEFIDNPFGLVASSTSDLVGPVQLLFAGPIFVALTAPFARWRHAGPIERAQLKWIGASGAAIIASIGFYAIAFGPTSYEEIGDLSTGVALAMFPIAIGIAILRYRLFDIDRLISRTLGWAIVSGSVAAIYVAAVLVLQTILGGFTQGGTLAVAASTLLAAATFQPLRRRVQSAVDRRFNRARVDAERAAAAFADRVRDEVELEALARDLDAAARDAIAPRSIGLWLHARNDSRTTNG